MLVNVPKVFCNNLDAFKAMRLDMQDMQDFLNKFKLSALKYRVRKI